MSIDESTVTDADPVIVSVPNGPLRVRGALPLYRRRISESEHGEPLTWEVPVRLAASDTYVLCRCGASTNKPFCDGTHKTADFDGSDTAGDVYDDRASTLGGTGITVRDDRSICVHAGFCGNRVTNIWKQVDHTEDSLVRLAVINEVEKCPSGALTYSIDGDEIEQLLPEAVSIIDDGPIWVTGGVAVSSADGRRLETRNRVTLCRCGASANKPLCDGSHKDIGFTDH